MSRLAFAPRGWLPDADLRERAEEARSIFETAHPHRRRPADREGELRELAWTLAPIRTEQQLHLACSRALEFSKHHFPKADELRRAVARTVGDDERAPTTGGGRAELDAYAAEMIGRLNARNAAILEGLGLRPGELAMRDEGLTLGQVVQPLLERLERDAAREAVAELTDTGDLAAVAAAKRAAVAAVRREWRECTGPDLDTLTAVVAQMAAEGRGTAVAA